MLDFNKIIKSHTQPLRSETDQGNRQTNPPVSGFADILALRINESRIAESQFREPPVSGNTEMERIGKAEKNEKREYSSDIAASEEKPKNGENAPAELKHRTDKKENAGREDTEILTPDSKNTAKTDGRETSLKITAAESQKKPSGEVKNRKPENHDREKLIAGMNHLGGLLQSFIKNHGIPAASLKELGEALECMKAKPDLNQFRQIISKIKALIGGDGLKNGGGAELSKLMNTALNLQEAVKNLSEKNKKQGGETKSGSRSHRDGETHKTAAERQDASFLNAKTDITAHKKGEDANSFAQNLNHAKGDIRREISSPPAQKHGMGEQFQGILDQAKIVVRDSKNGSFTVKLHPKELGSVNVNLGLEKGVVTGKFIVETAEAKDLLQQNLMFIRQELSDAGITVGDFLVNVRDEGRSYYMNGESEHSGGTLPGLPENNEVSQEYAVNSYTHHDGSINLVI